LIKSAIFLREFVTRPWVPPRHRVDRVLPQGAPVGAAGVDGRCPCDPRGTRAGRGPRSIRRSLRLSLTGFDPAVVGLLLGAVGLAWGFAADRIAARWPAHDDGSIRPVDWRTPIVMVVGAVALWALPARFPQPNHVLLFAAWFLVLQLLLATDLDQRLLPDVITLPMIPIALAVAALGWDPLVAGQLPSAIVAAIAVPAILFALSIPFGAGAIGIGDIKLLVSVGLLTGLGRAVLGVVPPRSCRASSWSPSLPRGGSRSRRTSRSGRS
jgi:leader peptidase (prepilin peptidase)/N-methyltransferase